MNQQPENKNNPMAQPPNYRLSVLSKSTKKTGKLGAAWNNPDGSISIVVDPGCSLVYNEDFSYRLFPVTEELPIHSPRVRAAMRRADERDAEAEHPPF